MMSLASQIVSNSPPHDRSYVLLVDDHEPSLGMLRAIVEGAGHRCKTAGSAAEALMHCDRRRPRVVVTDLAMPNLDGRGLACWLNTRFPSVPLILVTAESLDGASIETLRRTFTEVLFKPLDVERLLGCLDRLRPAPAIGEGPLTKRPAWPYDRWAEPCGA